jgi:uncharacterized integral membrane protein
MQLFLFLALIITILLAILAFQNPELITIRFVKWSLSGSLAFVLATTFLTGILTGIFLFIPFFWRKARTARAQKRQIRELEKRLTSSTGEDGGLE